MTEASPDAGRWMRRARLLMVGLLAAAAVAHVLATLQHPFVDESFYTKNLQHFFTQRTILPEFYFYPTLFSYMVAPVTGLFAGAMVLSGMPPSLGDWREVSYFERLYALWPQRLVALICLAIACWLAYVILLELTQRRWPGLLGATLLATAPGTLEYAGLGVADVPTMMFTTAALLYGLRLARGEEVRRNALLAGLLGGLAMATKYNAVLIAPALLVAVWVGGANRGDRARLLGRAVAGGIAGFLIGCPGWLIVPGEFIEGIRYQMEAQSAGQIGHIGTPFLGQIELMLQSDPHLLLLALVGAVIVMKSPRRRPEATVVVTLLVAGFILAAPGARQRLHYLLPVWPVMAILSAWGIAVARRRLKLALGGLATAAAVAACGFIVIQGFTMAAVPRSEDVARRWLYAHVEPMTPIVVEWIFVPEMIDSEELADLTSSIETDYVRNLYAGLVPYPTTRPGYSPEFLENTEREYIVTSSGYYERFFKFGTFAHRPPGKHLPVRGFYDDVKAFYEALFAGHAGWRPVYDVSTGNGPRVVIFARGEALEKHGARPMELP